MAKMFRRGTALILAMILILGQLALPASADDGADNSLELPVVEVPIKVENPVDIPSAPGGGMEQVVVPEADVTITDNGDGTISATATITNGTDTNGATVNAKSEVEIVDNGDGTGTILSEDTEYKVESADGTFTAEGGKEIKTEQAEDPVPPPAILTAIWKIPTMP